MAEDDNILVDLMGSDDERILQTGMQVCASKSKARQEVGSPLLRDRIPDFISDSAAIPAVIPAVRAPADSLPADPAPSPKSSKEPRPAEDDEFRNRPDFSGFRTRTRKQPIRYPTPTVFDRLEVVPHASQARDAHVAHDTITKTRRRSGNQLIKKNRGRKRKKNYSSSESGRKEEGAAGQQERKQSDSVASYSYSYSTQAHDTGSIGTRTSSTTVPVPVQPVTGAQLDEMLNIVSSTSKAMQYRDNIDARRDPYGLKPHEQYSHDCYTLLADIGRAKIDEFKRAFQR